MRNEYVRMTNRGEKVQSTTNTVEGYYSIFKRGMKGVYQHCAEHHLHRYLAEFDFRYSNRIALGIDDGTRAVVALNGRQGQAPHAIEGLSQAKRSALPEAGSTEAAALAIRKAPAEADLRLRRALLTAVGVITRRLFYSQQIAIDPLCGTAWVLQAL